MAAQLEAIAARELVEDLGFLLVPGPPLGIGRAYLIVAIRRSPTLAHFDPEQVDYWQTVNQRGAPVTVDASTPDDAGEFSWGEIRIVDRLGAQNVFAAFGGGIETRRFDSTRILLFSSQAPIVARGGHSQEWGAESHEIDAHIACMRAAAVPGSDLERRLAAASPVARYASFLVTRIASASAGERRAGWSKADQALLRAEGRRLRTQAPADWDAGARLAEDLARRGVS